ERMQGNYLFRNLTYGPLILAGYLFAAERRVPALAGHVLTRDVEWTWTDRLVAPRGWLLPDDPIAAGQGADAGIEVCADLDALTERFWVEVQALCGPFVESYVAAKYIARANGWGTVLAAVASGFGAAVRGGEAAVGLDEVWARY